MIKEKIEKIIENNKSYYKWKTIIYSLPDVILKYIKKNLTFNS
jgi:hypothetical protein